ncbi:GAF domain-containing protein [Amycolatopsis mediterranei]|uniref:GAF domain-containing protein n=1 Tax=Amycolatopsis mediterranei TaxID=33910 RepID=UPI00341D5435
MCRQVVHAIPDTGMASITLLREDTPYTVARTGDGARRVDQAQYDGDEGPCLEAVRIGQVQQATASEAALRWPQFAAAAGEAAVTSFLSAPLFIDDEYQGVAEPPRRRPRGIWQSRRGPARALHNRRRSRAAQRAPLPGRSGDGLAEDRPRVANMASIPASSSSIYESVRHRRSVGQARCAKQIGGFTLRRRPSLPPRTTRGGRRADPR